ncbi:MAG: TrkH family potassium uptake protein [Acholeplasmataceae bacterium]|jgi:trk system potassium uptake protein TrkH|nr:TrkH family potassium uptake protein [Acholeplasmataceae bacterium]
MNYRMVFRVIGNLLRVEAGLLLLPLIVSFIYKENLYYTYLIAIGILLVLSFILTAPKLKSRKIYARDGIVIVGLSWILMSFFGSLPFLISGEISNFFDAFFESSSGFTTTGASVLENVEGMSHSLLFWRSLTNWMGGMGVLVFVLAIMPNTDARSMYIMQAESPGPQVGKLVSKVRLTARILYGIYIALTVILIAFLTIKMPLFDSICHGLSTAGTGGFTIKNTSIGYYNSVYIDVVITVFMILFGVNFNLFYLILVGNIKSALKSEEFKTYFAIIAGAIILITINLVTSGIYQTVGQALRYSSFQVGTIISTTGFSTTDYNLWPAFSKWILILLMFVGGSAGSTAGGIKVSRIVIMFKMVVKEIKYNINPNRVTSIYFEGKPIEHSVGKGVYSFFLAYVLMLLLVTLIISIDGMDMLTNFTATLSCMSNVGPGFELVGPMGNYSGFSSFSKLILSFVMISGRLEIFPILILFAPNIWKR